MAKLLAALLVLGGVLWFAAGADATWLAMSGGQRVLKLAGAVCGGIASYFVTLFLLGFRLQDFRRRTD